MTVADDLHAEAGATAEAQQVYRHRYREAREAGMSIVEASLFADSDGDLAELRRLVELGCPIQLIRRIVL